MFGKNDCKYKGHRKTGVNKLWNILKRREARGEAIVIKIDEFRTSKVCNSCKTKNLNNIVTADGIRHNGVQECKNCRTLWDRDVNASKNMFYIAKNIWDGHGRPNEFSRAVSGHITATNAVPKRV